jgi:hypothetical protein
MRIQLSLLTTACLAAALAGCNATAPTIGDSNAKTAATGAAGGANAENANSQLEKCSRSMGTIAVVEDQQATWFTTMQSYKLRSTVPVLRMLIQQSNCFVVVERGAAMQNMQQERALQQSGELRSNSNFGKGQMVSADYSLNPSITFSEKGTGGMGAALGAFGGGLLGAVAGGIKFNDASTMLVLVDNRSGVQLSAAEGSSRNTDFNLFGGLFGGGAGGAAGGFTNTPEGKVITAAFIDSFNQMVRALRNYKAQTVEGGLGTGGTLGVDGATKPAVAAPAVAAPAAPAAPAKTTPKKTTKKAPPKKPVVPEGQ